MRISNLFFHIHYCNSRQYNEYGRYPGRNIRTVKHHKLIFIIEGKGSILIEKKRYPVKEGMLFYICPDVPHAIDLDIEEAACLLSVHFSYARVNFNDSTWGIQSVADMLPLYPGQELRDYYLVEDIFKKLVDTWNAKLPGYEFMARTLLQQLLMAIYQNTKKKNQNYANSLKVEQIIQYMHQNIDNRVTLMELSERVHLSPPYLSRSFKEITGYSVIEYFNKMKIDKAKELFIEGNKKVKEVAQTLGFTDEFYFSRIFKKIEGMSPSEYYSKNVHGI